MQAGHRRRENGHAPARCSRLRQPDHLQLPRGEEEDRRQEAARLALPARFQHRRRHTVSHSLVKANFLCHYFELIILRINSKIIYLYIFTIFIPIKSFYLFFLFNINLCLMKFLTVFGLYFLIFSIFQLLRLFGDLRARLVGDQVQGDGDGDQQVGNTRARRALPQRPPAGRLLRARLQVLAEPAQGLAQPVAFLNIFFNVFFIIKFYFSIQAAPDAFIQVS